MYLLAGTVSLDLFLGAAVGDILSFCPLWPLSLLLRKTLRIVETERSRQEDLHIPPLYFMCLTDLYFQAN